MTPRTTARRAALRRAGAGLLTLGIAAWACTVSLAQDGGSDAGGASSLDVAQEKANTAKDADEALDRWEDVLALEPPKSIVAYAHWMRGQAARALGLYPDAAREFDRVAHDHKRDFDRGRALLAKGLAELEAGEPRDALENLREAVRSARNGDDRAQAELAFASANYRLGNVREALRRFDRFQADHPKDARAHWAAWRSVICLRLLGREREAVERTERMEHDEPGSLAAVLARQEVRMGASAPRGSTPGAPSKTDGAETDGATDGDKTPATKTP